MTQLKAGLTMFLLDEWMRPRTSRKLVIVQVNEAGIVGWLAANKDAWLARDIFISTLNSLK